MVPVNDPDRLAADILRYVKNETLRSRHGKAARQRVMKRFDLTSMVANYEGVYDRLLVGQNQAKVGCQ